MTRLSKLAQFKQKVGQSKTLYELARRVIKAYSEGWIHPESDDCTEAIDLLISNLFTVITKRKGYSSASLRYRLIFTLRKLADRLEEEEQYITVLDFSTVRIDEGFVVSVVLEGPAPKPLTISYQCIIEED